MLCLGFQDLREALGLGNDDHDRRAAVPQDGAVAAQVVLDLALSSGRVNGDGDAARHENAQEGKEIVRPRGQHDDDRLSGPEPPALQPGGQGFRAFPELSVGQDVALALIAVEAHVRPVGMAAHVPVHNVHERLGRVGRGQGFTQLLGPDLHVRGGRAGRVGAEHGPKQVPRRFRVREDALGDRDLEVLFDAGEEFHPCQAVQPQIPSQRAVERHRPSQRPARMKLDGQFVNRLQQQGGFFFHIIYRT